MTQEKVQLKVLQYYTVKMEVIAPLTLTYRLLAASPEEALEKAALTTPVEISKPHLNRLKKIKVKVYQAGTTILKLFKNF